MSFDIRYPNITGLSEREQLSQMKSYLHQLVDQLQWAFNTIDTSSNSSSIINPIPRSAASPPKSADAQASFDAIKGLIIKSADIVEAYYEEISSRLEGIYVAESDFGVFVQQTSQETERTSTMSEQKFTNIQRISDELSNSLRTMKTDVDNSLEGIKGAIENINYTLVSVNANIKPGLLYYDENGIPVYGLEVGQRTMIDGVEVFNKYARFTSDRLSFYDQNDNEVAYISDRKLYINHIEIKGTFKMGGFVKTVLADGSIVKRWVVEGGEG
jgi:hypothetical protein